MPSFVLGNMEFGSCDCTGLSPHGVACGQGGLHHVETWLKLLFSRANPARPSARLVFLISKISNPSHPQIHTAKEEHSSIITHPCEHPWC